MNPFFAVPLHSRRQVTVIIGVLGKAVNLKGQG